MKYLLANEDIDLEAGYPHIHKTFTNDYLTMKDEIANFLREKHYPFHRANVWVIDENGILAENLGTADEYLGIDK